MKIEFWTNFTEIPCALRFRLAHWVICGVILNKYKYPQTYVKKYLIFPLCPPPLCVAIKETIKWIPLRLHTQHRFYQSIKKTKEWHFKKAVLLSSFKTYYRYIHITYNSLQTRHGKIRPRRKQKKSNNAFWYF